MKQELKECNECRFLFYIPAADGGCPDCGSKDVQQTEKPVQHKIEEVARRIFPPFSGRWESQTESIKEFWRSNARAICAIAVR